MFDYNAYFNSVSASVTGCKEGIYINPRNCEARINIKDATNADKINSEGVTHVCINRATNGTFYIFQASGYTPDKGMFIDMY